VTKVLAGCLRANQCRKAFYSMGHERLPSLVTPLRFIMSGVSCGSPRSKAEQGTEGAQQWCSCAVTLLACITTPPLQNDIPSAYV
jgi:hypothetical protein